MESGKKSELRKSWVLIFLPTFVVLIFILLHRRLPGPTAGGLSFLVAIVISYFLFPKIKLDFVKLIIGVVLALAVAYGLAEWSGWRI